jgi:hypothetical protein
MLPLILRSSPQASVSKDEATAWGPMVRDGASLLLTMDEEKGHHAFLFAPSLICVKLDRANPRVQPISPAPQTGLNGQTRCV